MPRGKWAKGKFYPKNPSKFVGKKAPTYRSSWEQRFMVFCDENSNVKYWDSESIEIKYIDPFTGKQRRYIPDFLIQYVDANGKTKTELIEIKPRNQTTLKEAGRSKRNQYQAKINEAKWKYALAFCAKMGIEFRVITENEIFHTGKK